MKVTLIYPGITECGFNSLKGNEGSWMNHGLAIISAVLKNKGYVVNLIDLRRLKGWEHFKQVVRDDVEDVVGITMMSVDYDAGVMAANIIKEINPKVKIFVGGPHASICPDELENVQSIDCIVRGEAEITFPNLLLDLANGSNLPKVVEGIRLDNLDDSPWADRDLFQSPEEPFVPFLKPPFVTLIASRGCKYNCNYCQPAERIMFGKKVRRRSVLSVINELKCLNDRYHFNSFMIHDDCLTEDRQWVIDFCKQYKAERFTQPFVAQSRADIICKHPDMIKALYKAGLRLCIIGFESGSDRVLKFLRKGANRAQNLEAARICKTTGIKIWANYMLGIPTESKEEVLETLSMLESIKPYHCSPAFYTPHPGSDLFAIGKEMGIHLITNHSSYRRNTYEPKIKGPDYDFLKNVLYKSIAVGEDNLPQNDVIKEFSFVFLFKNIRGRLKILLLSKFPKTYHFLKSITKKFFIYHII